MPIAGSRTSGEARWRRIGYRWNKGHNSGRCVDCRTRSGYNRGEAAMILHAFPNYDKALPVEEVAPGSLGPAEFHQQYVLRNRPFVVRGGAGHWPACTTWNL